MKILLLSNKFKNKYEIFTVKESKGLEFKKVFVISDSMTENEAYIAYTRALVELIIIQNIPQKADRSVKLFVQGIESEIDDNTDL